MRETTIGLDRNRMVMVMSTGFTISDLQFGLHSDLPLTESLAARDLPFRRSLRYQTEPPGYHHLPNGCTRPATTHGPKIQDSLGENSSGP